MNTDTITETGCYLDNHRGHYISRDVVQMAVEYGFIIDPFAQWALNTYEDRENYSDYPDEAIIELADEATNWLNSGQEDCTFCHGTSKAANGWVDKDGVSRCKPCTGTGRGPRVAGQNFPPKIPEGYVWEFNDGDYGIYKLEDEG